MEYKFRCFDAVGKKGWVYGDLAHNKKVTKTGLEDRVMVGGYEVVPESVGLSTGLFDCDGKEVFEGDIVRNTWCFLECDSVIKFGDYQHISAQQHYVCGDRGFYLYHEDMIVRGITRNDILYFFGNDDKGKVVGNVFENKDSLFNE